MNQTETMALCGVQGERDQQLYNRAYLFGMMQAYEGLAFQLAEIHNSVAESEKTSTGNVQQQLTGFRHCVNSVVKAIAECARLVSDRAKTTIH